MVIKVCIAEFSEAVERYLGLVIEAEKPTDPIHVVVLTELLYPFVELVQPQVEERLRVGFSEGVQGLMKRQPPGLQRIPLDRVRYVQHELDFSGPLAEAH